MTLGSMKKASISDVLCGKASLDVINDELCCAFRAKLRAVDRKVVAFAHSPAFVGVEVVVVCAKFVLLNGHFFGFFFCLAIASFDDSLDSVFERRVKEDADDVSFVAQDVVGASSHNQAWPFASKVNHHLALRLIYTVFFHWLVTSK